MKLQVVGLGLLVSAATLAVPERATAGVQVHVGVVLGRQGYVGGDGYRSRDASRYRRDASRYGFERGSREGAKQGYKDARKGRRFDFVRDRDFRDSDDGYKRWMGSRRAYESAFRRGFAEAYRRGFEQGRRDRRGRDDWRRDDDRDWRDRDRRDRDRW